MPRREREPGLRVGLHDVRRRAAGVTRTLHRLDRAVRRDAHLDRVAGSHLGQLLQREPDRRPPGRRGRAVRVGPASRGERGAAVRGLGASARGHGRNSAAAARAPRYPRCHVHDDLALAALDAARGRPAPELLTRLRGHRLSPRRTCAAPPPEGVPMTRMLTGERPTGPLHIGHLFGTVANRVRLQRRRRRDVPRRRRLPGDHRPGRDG